jgi:hypothetical protein
VLQSRNLSAGLIPLGSCAKSLPGDGVINNTALKNLNKVILCIHRIFWTFSNMAYFPVA